MGRQEDDQQPSVVTQSHRDIYLIWGRQVCVEEEAGFTFPQEIEIPDETTTCETETKVFDCCGW